MATVKHLSKKSKVCRYNSDNNILEISIFDSEQNEIMLFHDETMALIKILNEWKDYYFGICSYCGIEKNKYPK